MLIGILLGIMINVIINNKIFKKNILRKTIFISFDILKMLFIKYNILFILLSLLLSISINNDKLENKNNNKFLTIILYVLLPINGYITNLKLYKNKDILLLVIPNIIYIFVKYKNIIVNSSYKNILCSIIIGIISYFLAKKQNKKRNIIFIFLLFIIMFYYFILP